MTSKVLMPVMKRLISAPMTMPILAAILTLVLSCGQTPPRVLTPEGTVEQFLTACASADTSMVASLSSLRAFPLVTSWVVRRAAPSSVYRGMTVAVLTDSILVDIRQRRAACEQELEGLANQSVERSRILDPLRTQIRDKTAELYRAGIAFDGATSDFRAKAEYKSRVQRELWHLQDELKRMIQECPPEATPEFEAAQNRLAQTLLEEEEAKIHLKALSMSAQLDFESDARRPKILEAMVIADIRGGGIVTTKTRFLLLATDLAKPQTPWVVAQLGPL